MAYYRQLESGKWLARVWIPQEMDVDDHQPSKTFDLKRDAKAWAAEIERKVNRGEYFEDKEVSLTDCCEQWLEQCIEREKWDSGRTEDRNRGLIKNHIKPELGHYKPGNLNPADIEDFYAERMNTGKRSDGREKPVGYHSVRQMHNVLRQAYKMAVKRKYISQENNPMSLVDLPSKANSKSSGSKRVYLNQEEVSHFLEVVREQSPYWIFWILGFYTGGRKSEIFGLKHSDISQKNSNLTFDRKLEIRDDGKPEFGPLKTNNAYRTISVQDPLINALDKWEEEQKSRAADLGEEWLNEHDLICTSKEGTPIRNIRRDLRNLKKELEINDEKLEYFSIHDMRHTHASLILNEAPEGDAHRYLKIVSQRLGHCNVQFTLDTYGHVLPELEQEVADAALDGVEIEISG